MKYISAQEVHIRSYKAGWLEGKLWMDTSHASEKQNLAFIKFSPLGLTNNVITAGGLPPYAASLSYLRLMLNCTKSNMLFKYSFSFLSSIYMFVVWIAINFKN